jgi:hypothetical protein
MPEGLRETSNVQPIAAASVARYQDIAFVEAPGQVIAGLGRLGQIP